MNDEEKYKHWMQTGENPDGRRQSVILIYIHENDGILSEDINWNVYGDTTLTPINAKRVRKAADAAWMAVSDELDNLEKP